MNKEKYVATVVFYITSSCNLRCEYCFEKDGRPDKALTKEDIDDKLKWIDENLADYSDIVIFGGEPLLRLDLVEYIIDELMTTYKDRYFSMSMNTNGILLLNDNIFEKYKKIISKRQLTVSISYDGPNSFRRKDINDNCVNDEIIKVLRKLEENNLDYVISYTWHKENDKTIIKDMVYICENFKPKRIVISPNCIEIDQHCSGDIDYETYMNSYTPYFEAVFLEYKIPICQFTCKMCRKCTFNQKNVYIVPTKKELIINPKKTNTAFTLWD